MTHIDKFLENNIQDTKSSFKDKIDWKFYNFLQYNLTKLEDTNNDIKAEINIAILSGDGSTAHFHNIFCDNKYIQYYDYNLQQLLKCYDENQLFYIVKFFTDIDYKILNKFNNSIYNKSSNIDNIYYDDDTYINAMDYYREGSILPVIFLIPNNDE